MIDWVGRSVAVVGAGVSGLVCAQRLQNVGCEVQVLDKSGDIGGRLATRLGPEGFWNHGAQGLAVSQPEFAVLAGDLVAAESAAFVGPESSLAGQPYMRELLRPLADEVECRFDCAVGSVARVAGGWRLLDQQGGLHGDFAALVLAMPAPQALGLLSTMRESASVTDLAPELARLVDSLAVVEYASCWSLLVQGPRLHSVLSELVELPVSGSDVIAGIYPQADTDYWVVHATAQWSARHLEEDRASAAQALLMELKSLCSAAAGFRVEQVEAHRWRYSTVSTPAALPALWSSELGLGLCGDWCQPAATQAVSDAHGAQAAFLSGGTLAELMGAGLAKGHDLGNNPTKQ